MSEPHFIALFREILRCDANTARIPSCCIPAGFTIPIKLVFCMQSSSLFIRVLVLHFVVNIVNANTFYFQC